MEPVLSDIFKNEIKLNKKDVKIRNGIMRQVMDIIWQKTKKLDPMFNGSQIFYGGSYFCGTKIKLPDEYDIDILVKLPFKTHLSPHKSGFLSIQLQNFDENMFNGKYRSLKSCLNHDNYILPTKIQDWYKSLVQLSLNNFSVGVNSKGYIMNTQHGPISVKMSESGPAITLHIHQKAMDVNIDLDLVLSFKFPISDYIEVEHYAVQSCRKLTSREFFVVPKPPKDEEVDRRELLWTPSFQEVENQLIHDMNQLKPCIKILKFLRDQWDHKSIKSYFIKTIVMNMLASVHYPSEFWRCSTSYVFMQVLKYYNTCLEEGHIYSFWYKNKDLLENITDEERKNISRKIKKIINKIEDCLKMKRVERIRARAILRECFALETTERTKLTLISP